MCLISRRSLERRRCETINRILIFVLDAERDRYRVFENCSIIIIANGSHVDELYRLEVDADTQKEICLSFDSAVDDLLSEKTKISFDGSYKPHNDEFLAIENFQLSDAIKDAIRDPLGVPA